MSDELTVRLDTESWRFVQSTLKRTEPEVYKELQKEVRKSATKVATLAKANASWSSRIPGAIGVSVTTRQVGVRVRRAKAPHGRAFEGTRKNRGSFRHPVFGNRDVWVSQNVRPFLQPAVDQTRPQFIQDAGSAINSAAARAGWSRSLSGFGR